MSEEVHVDTGELHRLGTAFAHHAYDLERHLSAFRRRAGAEALRDELGADSASLDEFGNLADEAGRVVERLRERFDEIADGLKSGAARTDAAEQDVVAALRGVR